MVSIASPETGGGEHARGSTARLLGATLASVAVLGASLLAGFRLDFGGDLATLVAVNGPRVAVGAAAGALLALAAILRLEAGRERPLRELEILGAAAGAAGGGVIAVGLLGPGWPFSAGALIGGAALFGVARLLDRPRRVANLGALAFLAVGAALFTIAGVNALHVGPDLTAAVLRWLFGSLVGAGAAGGVAMLAALVLLLALALRPGPPREGIAPVAFGVAVGGAGPIAFVGALAARAARALARDGSRPAVVIASGALGAAFLVGLDTVSRLLMGGYAISTNLAATLVAFPLFLGWNRRRLRRRLGRSGLAFELLELLLIAVASVLALGFAGVITAAVRAAT